MILCAESYWGPQRQAVGTMGHADPGLDSGNQAQTGLSGTVRQETDLRKKFEAGTLNLGAP